MMDQSDPTRWKSPNLTPSPNNTWTSPRFRGGGRPRGRGGFGPSPNYQYRQRTPSPYNYPRQRSPYHPRPQQLPFGNNDFQHFGSPSPRGGGFYGGRGQRFRSPSPHQPQRFYRPPIPFNNSPRNQFSTPSPSQSVNPNEIERWVSPKMWEDPWKNLLNRQLSPATSPYGIDLNPDSSHSVNLSEEESIQMNASEVQQLPDPNEIDLDEDILEEEGEKDTPCKSQDDKSPSNDDEKLAEVGSNSNPNPTEPKESTEKVAN